MVCCSDRTLCQKYLLNILSGLIKKVCSTCTKQGQRWVKRLHTFLFSFTPFYQVWKTHFGLYMWSSCWQFVTSVKPFFCVVELYVHILLRLFLSSATVPSLGGTEGCSAAPPAILGCTWRLHSSTPGLPWVYLKVAQQQYMVVLCVTFSRWVALFVP